MLDVWWRQKTVVMDRQFEKDEGHLDSNNYQDMIQKVTWVTRVES